MGDGELVFDGTEFQFGMMKSSGMDGGDGCTTGMYLIPLKNSLDGSFDVTGVLLLRNLQKIPPNNPA